MSEISESLADKVAAGFKDGWNTVEIAGAYRLPEWQIERALHIGLERRRVQRVAEAIGANV